MKIRTYLCTCITDLTRQKKKRKEKINNEKLCQSRPTDRVFCQMAV